MRKFLAIAAAAALATVAGAASAEDVAASTAAAPALTLKAGRLVVSADGRVVGRIDRVEATRIGVIADSRYIYIPTSTLSAGEKTRIATSLTAKEVLGKH